MAVAPNVSETAVLVVLHNEIDVVRDIKIHIPVIVDIAEGTTGAPGARGRACVAGNVLETAAPGVPVEPVRAVAGHVKIGPPIVVVIRRAGAHTETGNSDARGLGHVRETPSSLIAVEPVVGPLRHSVIDKGASVDKKDIGPAVVVEVQDQRARTHDFGKMFFRTRSVFVPEIDSGLRSDVREIDASFLWHRTRGAGCAERGAPCNESTGNDPGRGMRLHAGSWVGSKTDFIVVERERENKDQKNSPAPGRGSFREDMSTRRTIGGPHQKSIRSVAWNRRFDSPFLMPIRPKSFGLFNARFVPRRLPVKKPEA